MSITKSQAIVILANLAGRVDGSFTMKEMTTALKDTPAFRDIMKDADGWKEIYAAADTNSAESAATLASSCLEVLQGASVEEKTEAMAICRGIIMADGSMTVAERDLLMSWTNTLGLAKNEVIAKNHELNAAGTPKLSITKSQAIVILANLAGRVDGSFSMKEMTTALKDTPVFRDIMKDAEGWKEIYASADTNSAESAATLANACLDVLQGASVEEKTEAMAICWGIIMADGSMTVAERDLIMPWLATLGLAKNDVIAKYHALGAVSAE
jgi:uncharacterized tellurite resistance protein B-like protein